MTGERLERLHAVLDARDKRKLSQCEENELQSLMDEWYDDEFARERRMNASVNIPDYGGTFDGFNVSSDADPGL